MPYPIEISPQNWEKIRACLNQISTSIVGKEEDCYRFICAIAYPCASGGKGGTEQGLSRSCGGYTTKIHATTDGLGNPLQLVITGGNRHDIIGARELLGNQEVKRLIGDRAFDVDWVLEWAESGDIEAVIPPKKNRRNQGDYDSHHYKERHLIECFFNKLKHYRRVFSRFDKLKRNFLAFVCFTSTLIWLR